MPKTEEKKAPELKLISKPISVAADGNTLSLNTDNVGDLVFFQIANKNGNVVEANGVASIRVSVGSLKALRKLIDDALTDHEKKMADKGKTAEKLA